MDFLTVLFFLIIGHFLCDFPWQNDYLAINKFPIVRGHINPVWKWCMTAHCAIHMLPVMLVTQNIYYGLIMFVSHFIIDYAKCRDRITYDTDQILHLAVVFWIAVIYCV